MLTWAAFECSTYAERSLLPGEQQRLFLMGIESGRAFLEALSRGDISEEDLRTRVPIGVHMHAKGPTVDFMLGRIFATASTEALHLLSRGSKISATPVAEWTADPEVWKVRAENEYRTRNCQLLR